MKTPLTGALCFWLFVAFVAAAPARSPYVEGELLVKFRGGPRGPAATLARDRMNHQVRRDFNFIGWQQIRLPPGMKVEQALARYANLPNVLAVEPNGIVEGAATPLIPNDSRFNEQYGLAKIAAPNAWGFSIGISNIVVTVIDGGVNYFHEDLAANLWRNPGEVPGNGVDDDGNGHVDDIYG